MPLVSVLLAVHDDARFVGEAVESVLSQTLRDLELIVVDDASTDETPEILAAISDPRLLLLANDEQRGLAASLNHGLDRAGGRYFARIDADDVALPARLERQVAWIEAETRTAIVGSAVIDLDAEGARGRTHLLPLEAVPLRWHALFSSPFFHPTVLVDRELLDAHGLCYDPSYIESEDYELWTRLFAFADGANLAEPLVLKRVHPEQASLRRSDIQQAFQRRVALREIARVAPETSPEDAELAWALGSRRGVPAASRSRAGRALVQVLAAFETRHGPDPNVRAAAARSLARGRLPWPALKLAATRRRSPARRALGPSSVVQVTVVSPEPTPYRSPLFDRIAGRREIDLTVVYAARSVAERTWSVEPKHRHLFLPGFQLPWARRLVRHDYPVTPGIVSALRRSRPDVVVISGWSTFASQTAIAWCRVHRVPYVLQVESHDLEPRAVWRRAVKGAIVPRLMRRSAGVLAVGSAARASAVARGARPESVRVFANTIDVQSWAARADRLERQRGDDEVVVLCVARLAREKGLDVLLRAMAQAGDERLRLVVAGDGPERHSLAELASHLGVRLACHGDVGEDALAQLYVDADVFALLSRHEPWGVVVNEAAASGLPLVLSERVGAARDLLRDGDNGFLVPAEDVPSAAAALKKLADDRELRRRMGARSRELVRDWGYEPSVEGFLAGVREATSR